MPLAPRARSSVGLGWVIHRPYMDRDAKVVGVGNEAAGGDGKKVVPVGHREGVILDPLGPGASGGADQEPQDVLPACADQEASAPEARERIVVFGGDDTLLGGVVSENDIAYLLLSRHLLQLDEHRHRGERRRALHEGRNAGAAAELGEGTGDEGPGHFGRALESGVMVHHHLAIGGQADIELEGVHPKFGGAVESGQCVLRRLRRSAAVCHEWECAGVHQDVHGAAAANLFTISPVGSIAVMPSTLFPACQKSLLPDSSSEACLSWKSDFSA